ncbi:unnamed protein product [Caretta caretta]
MELTCPPRRVYSPTRCLPLRRLLGTTNIFSFRTSNRLSGKGWVLDQTSIFAQVDAFVQRCKDLLEAIKRTFDKKAVDVYMLFNRELALVNKELSKKLPFLPAHMCHYAGLAHWLRALHRRIDRPLKDHCYAVPRGEGLVQGVDPIPGQEDPARLEEAALVSERGQCYLHQ